MRIYIICDRTNICQVYILEKELYYIFRKGSSSQNIGGTGISVIPLEIVHTPDFETKEEAKNYISEHEIPGYEFLIIKAIKYTPENQ